MAFVRVRTLENDESRSALGTFAVVLASSSVTYPSVDAYPVVIAGITVRFRMS
jgi:hypothetical protein